MSDIDVVHRDPQQAGRHLPHQLPNDVHRKLIGARQCARVGFEVVDRELQDVFQLPQLELSAL